MKPYSPTVAEVDRPPAVTRLCPVTTRQWWERGTANDDIVPHYKNKLMGNSPELMPLDSNLFGDLIESDA